VVVKDWVIENLEFSSPVEEQRERNPNSIEYPKALARLYGCASCLEERGSSYPRYLRPLWRSWRQ